MGIGSGRVEIAITVIELFYCDYMTILYYDLPII